MPDYAPWTTPGAGATTDVSDRPGRALGEADVIDRIARLLGHVIVDSGQVDVTDEPARALGAVSLTGTADVSDRAARALGVADINDRVARVLGVADVSDRGARRAGAVTPPAQWAITHAPAALTRATITRAAGGAGIHHVCTAVVASIAAPAAPSVDTPAVVLRDGATGAGTALLQDIMAIEAVAGAGDRLVATGLYIPGTANTAMTLEFATAPFANVFQRVTLVGYSTDTI